MKTLYVSDLDGTLLRHDETLSRFTIQTINALVEKGLLFSYATARSIVTASRVTNGLSNQIPVILYNGAFIRRPDTNELLASNFFGQEFTAVLDDLIDHKVYPIVYSLDDGIEKYRYWVEMSTPGMKFFNNSRAGDPRETPIHQAEELYVDSPFYMTCIDTTEKLLPLYEKYKERFHCVLHHDIYSGNQWLEIMPNESFQVFTGITMNTKDGAALTDSIFHPLERSLLLSNKGNDFTEAVLGDLYRLHGRSIALTLLFPVLTVLHQEVIEVTGIVSNEYLLSDIQLVIL